MRFLFSARLPLTRKKRLRGNSRPLYFALRRMTPRVGGVVWAEKEKGKRKKEKVKMTLVSTVLRQSPGRQSTFELSCFILPFTFLRLASLEIRAARKL